MKNQRIVHVTGFVDVTIGVPREVPENAKSLVPPRQQSKRSSTSVGNATRKQVASARCRGPGKPCDPGSRACDAPAGIHTNEDPYNESEESLMRPIYATKRASRTQQTLALTLSLACALVCLGTLCLPSVAAADSAWWHVTSSTRPSHLGPEGVGTVVATVENLGDDPAGGEGSPVKIADVLPAGLKPLAIFGAKWFGNTFQALSCSLPTLTCSLETPLLPYQQMEVRIRVKVETGAASGQLNRVSVSGAGAPPKTVERPIIISEEPTPFGVDDFELAAEQEGGQPTTQAGSHPFQVTGSYLFNQGEETEVQASEGPKPVVSSVGLPKDIDTLVPPGLIGDPTPLPTCTTAQFTRLTDSGQNAEENECPAQTAIGMATVTIDEPFVGYTVIPVPVFNLEPGYGEPARFGFAIPVAHSTIILDTSLRSGPGEDYGITVSSLNTTEQVETMSAQVTFWGVPGDPRHDSTRGWACLDELLGQRHGPCPISDEAHPPAFLTMPTACSGPLSASAEVSSWKDPSTFEATLPPEPLQSLDGCNELPFTPEMSAEPTTDRASAPSGLNVNLDFHDEGLTSAEGLAQSQARDVTVKLPEGVTINPSSGVGLSGCTPADFAKETIGSQPGEGCPNSSKLGTVEVQTPLLSVPIQGSLYIAQPYENPFPEPEHGHSGGTLIALYVVLKNPEKGILIKLAGKVTPNPVTGQLVTAFENNPELSFSHFNFHFREGQQAPLISPPTCGTYTTSAVLTPFSEPAEPLTDLSSFNITAAYDDGPCPAGGLPPFSPQISAGTASNSAGAFSPFDLHLTRTDAEGEISTFSTVLPPGLIGVLTGIPFCPEADIALARSKTGHEEEANPSCPAASELGHTLVGTGVGSVLAYTPGKLYLAGPYDGDPFSLVSVTSAVVGPFDLGTVVIRFGLRIDPRTAQVSVDPTASEPIPTIIKGIVTHVRDIRVYVNRPNFTLNPTSCEPMSISSTLSSNQGQTATVTSRFQAANCANLKFEPKVTLTTAAHASRTDGASLNFKISYPKGPLGTQSWFNEARFVIPKQLPSRLTTLQKACLAHVFETERANCPAASIIGHAIVHTPVLPVPLEGGVYFVSYGGAAFPDAVLVLNGYGVHIELHGNTLIEKGVTSATFRNTPDVPFESIEVTVPTGRYSEFGANLPHEGYDFCGQKLVAPTLFKAQNGLEIHENTPVTVTGCPKAKNKAQLLTAALKACHKKHGTKRASCEKAARKKYSAKAAKHAKKANKTGGHH